MNGPREHARGLLEKAAHDLVAADATIATGKALDTVCFHAQQAAEKSLKALLALKDIEYPWRHDIGELLALAAPHFPELAPLEERLLLLAPYAVEIRYGLVMTPGLDETRSALETARQVYEVAERWIGPAGDAR